VNPELAREHEKMLGSGASQMPYRSLHEMSWRVAASSVFTTRGKTASAWRRCSFPLRPLLLALDAVGLAQQAVGSRA
jgi:hypothetical protein